MASFFSKKNLIVMAPLGFYSGLPLALTGATLQAWLSVAQIDIRSIGLYSLIAIPYTFKFIWAPVLDRWAFPLLGRRRGWMLFFQALIAIFIWCMANTGPEKNLTLLAFFAFMTAFTSASQDIVFDAYRTDLLSPAERGTGAGISITGYRIGMLISGAFALVLADRIGWGNTYRLMALVMLLSIIVTILSPDPGHKIRPPSNFREAVWGPISQFFLRPGAMSYLLLIVFYKLGDAFAGTLSTAFLIKGMGFSPTAVGTINKGMGLLCTVAGALWGGALTGRLGLYRALFLFGILQAISNLAFMALAVAGKSYTMMALAVAVENLSGGMGTAAFVAFLMALCHRSFTATQYALLSAVAATGRIFVGPPSGYLVSYTGWPLFFFITFLAALPGIFMLWRMRNKIIAL